MELAGVQATQPPTPREPPTDETPLLPSNNHCCSERVRNCWYRFRTKTMEHCYYNPRICLTVPLVFFSTLSIYCTIDAVKSSSLPAAIFAGFTGLLTVATLRICCSCRPYTGGGRFANR